MISTGRRALDNKRVSWPPLQRGGIRCPQRAVHAKLKEVLRLRFELGLGQEQIARSCSIAQNTVSGYLRRAQRAGLGWPLPESWEDQQLEEALFGRPLRRVHEHRKPQPDWARIHEELQRHAHLTLQLVWEEYRQAHPEGYGYSRSSELYQRWRATLTSLFDRNIGRERSCLSITPGPPFRSTIHGLARHAPR